MITRRTLSPFASALLAAIVVCCVALPALGGPKEREERKERREDRKEEKKEKRDDLKDEWKKKHQDWVEKRKARREDRREELKKKWGAILDRPLVKAELRIHGRRVARIQRVHFLAEANGNAKLAESAKNLLAKEQARHLQRMEKLKVEVAK